MTARATDFLGLSRGFIPRRIGAVETAPQRMEALRAGRCPPPASASVRLKPLLSACKPCGLDAAHPQLGSVRLKPLLSTWKPCGLDTPSSERIGAVETAPQRMETLRARHPTPSEHRRG